MKSPKERSKERPAHVFKAIEKIERYTEQLTFEAFMNDPRTNDAILFRISIIGGAINDVDKTILVRYGYPWHEVRAQINVIAHEYFGIRMDKIWSVIKDDLPKLKALINQILKEAF
jgi:uncharacterized protein with HEPN domain